MIINCTECSRKYVVKPEYIGSIGRTVKCTACGHTWHQLPPVPDFSEDEVPLAHGVGEISSNELPAFQEFTEVAETFQNNTVDVEESKPIGSFAEDFSKPSMIPTSFGKEAPKKKGKMGAFLGFTIVLLCTSLVSFLYFGRYVIVKQWPVVGKIYHALDITTNPLAAQLELKNISWVPTMDDQNQPVFTLKGSIVSRSGKTEKIPPLSIVFIRANPDGATCNKPECIVDRWFVQPPFDQILPGEISSFQAVVNRAIPEKADHLYVEFVTP